MCRNNVTRESRKLLFFSFLSQMIYFDVIIDYSWSDWISDVG